MHAAWPTHTAWLRETPTLRPKRAPTMNRLPSLDDYDVQGVHLDEAALWGDDIRYAVEARNDSMPLEGFSVEPV